jgi:outer membrane protein assembly factor BamA
MSRGIYLRFVLVATLAFFLRSLPLNAQLPPRLERCLPSPTLAQEINSSHDARDAVQPSPEIAIVSIAFAPQSDLPEALRAQIIGIVKSSQLSDSPDGAWLQELQEVAIRGALQDEGYFKCLVEADKFLVEAAPAVHQYGLVLNIDSGEKYSLGEIRFANAREGQPLVFSESELRERFAMKAGDLLDASKVRRGLKELTALYGARGYIDMTPEPETDILDGAVLKMLIRIDEGKSYRIGKIEFLGLTEKTQAALRPQLKSGDIFDVRYRDELLRQNKSILPNDASASDVGLQREEREGVVNLTFDFRSCPGAEQLTPR